MSETIQHILHKHMDFAQGGRILCELQIKIWSKSLFLLQLTKKNHPPVECSSQNLEAWLMVYLKNGSVRKHDMLGISYKNINAIILIRFTVF